MIKTAYTDLGRLTANARLGITKISMGLPSPKNVPGLIDRGVDFAAKHPLAVGIPLLVAGVGGAAKGIHSAAARTNTVQEPTSTPTPPTTEAGQEQLGGLSPEEYDAIMAYYAQQMSKPHAL